MEAKGKNFSYKNEALKKLFDNLSNAQWNNFDGDWGLGIGDWGLGIGPNPQSPIPIFIKKIDFLIYFKYNKNM